MDFQVGFQAAVQSPASPPAAASEQLAAGLTWKAVGRKRKAGEGDANLRGRLAYERRAWENAYSALSDASGDGPLGADDVERRARRR